MNRASDSASQAADFGRRAIVVDRPPWHFRLAKSLQRRGRWGGNYLIEATQRLGLLDYVVRYQRERDVTLDVPLWRRPNQWDELDCENYEREALDALASAVAKLQEPIVWVDGGADIGAVSVLLAARGARFDRALAYEPNPEVLHILGNNLDRLAWGEVEVISRALSDRSGQGDLCSPGGDGSAHARFFKPAHQGPIAAEALDDRLRDTLLADGARFSLAMKLDLEGGELAALRGAEQCLRRAAGVAILCEAHPLVAKRTGEEPLDCWRYLRGLRPFQAEVSERPELRLSGDAPLFQQLSGPVIVNVLYTSVAEEIA
jgi:FkbM family methyltransferase